MRMSARTKAGVGLAGRSWRLLRSEPSTIVALVVGIIASCGVGLGAFVTTFGQLPTTADFDFPRYLLVVPFFWLAAFFSNCVACYVAILIDAQLRESPVDKRAALQRVVEKLPRILGWTLIGGLIGLVLYAIAERFRLAGSIARWLVGIAWGLANTFIVPVLVLEDLPVWKSIRRSAHLFKTTWAEKVTADVTTGVVMFLALIPAGLFVGSLALVSIPAAVVLGVILIAVFTAVSAALDSVVEVAAYHYATSGRTSAAFSEADILSLYKPE